MVISEIVAALEKAKAKHGDIPVVYPDFMMDGCGSGEVLSLVVRKAKAPKKGHIFVYHRGPYARNRYVKKDTDVVELRDSNFEEENEQ